MPWIRRPGWTPGRVLALCVAVKVALHVAVALTTSYGLHRDEFLYLAQGRHLAWGFLEVPPAIGTLAWVLHHTVGASLVSVRLVPALFGGALVAVTGGLVRAFGGGRGAIGLASLGILVAPVYLRASTLFQPVILDQLTWACAAWAVAERIRRDDPRWWMGVGLACGVGLLTKFSILLFGAALFVGLLCTRLRRDLRTPWPWLGAALSFTLAAPTLAWQAAHDWPLLHHLGALQRTQLVYVDRASLLVEQVLMLHPITLPLWGAGLWFLFRANDGAFRSLGGAYVTALALVVLTSGKAYYLAPAYPMLFAGGAVWWMKWTTRWRPVVSRGLLVAVLLLGGLVLAPIGVPVLPPPVMASYTAWLGLDAATRDEHGRQHTLPQDYADMLGWREQVDAVATAYHALSETDRERVVLFGDSYGHAGAIDLYGPALDLPSAVSASSSYYLWGPGPRPGDVVLFLGLPRDDVDALFETCSTQTVVRHRWAREDAEPIVLCRRPREPLDDVWRRLDPW